MKYYQNIKQQLINNEIYVKVKDYSKNKSLLEPYYNVGKLLFEAGKHYDESIIKEYSNKLIKDIGKKYNERTLRRMRQLYTLFKNEKWTPMATKLTWSHYCELLALNNIDEINYYINICETQNLSKRVR